ncbi:class C sortase [Leuconostoc lactis]|uniref:class C sortase n=1 Tax=Leuconostoc lactis TaxID=1246 RepID=UPI0028A16FF3|nr:class C sortase [Leuconostoc lactis]
MTLAQNYRPDWFRWLFAGIFILGFLIATYPFYVSAVNHFIDQQRLTTLARQQQGTSQPSQPNDHDDAVADPFSNAAPAQQIALKQQLLGSITVPSIGLHTPLFKTTNEVTLTYGATVLQNMDSPTGGVGTHCVIAGHRGLASRVLFTNLNRVKSGDIVILTLGDKKLAYQIFMTQVVRPADFQVLQRQPQQNLLTLVTCTPYMINSHRLLVTGRRVPYQLRFQKKMTQTIQSENLKQAGILLAIGMALGGQICWFWWRWRRSA